MIDGGMIVSVGTAAFTILSSAILTTWKVGRALDRRDATLVKMMTDHELSDTTRFADVRHAVDTAGDSIRHEFGETGLALRQHMHETEMWGRDNYLQKNSFYKATDEIKAMILHLDGKIEERSR